MFFHACMSVASVYAKSIVHLIWYKCCFLKTSVRNKILILAVNAISAVLVLLATALDFEKGFLRLTVN